MNNENILIFIYRYATNTKIKIEGVTSINNIRYGYLQIRGWTL